MIYVYDKLEDIPKDKKYIKDAEAWFESPLEETEVVKHIMTEVERGSFCDENFFNDRFGGRLYWDYLSTGSKAAILASSRLDYVVDTLEMGDNVFNCLFRNNISCNLFIEGAVTVIPTLMCYHDKCDIWYNGMTFDCVDSFNRWRKGVPLR